MGLLGKFQKKEAEVDNVPKPLDTPEVPDTVVPVGAEPASPDLTLDPEPVDVSAAPVVDLAGEESGGEEAPLDGEADDRRWTMTCSAYSRRRRITATP